MPRRARLSLPNVPLHLIQRGNNRQACFFAEDDYRSYLRWLGEYADKCGCRVHAYVLMTNHVHLLLSADEAAAPGALMKALGQRYVQYVNRSYRRSGTLWEGRYRSCLTQDEMYLLACQRYIELNPVRAAMVAHPGDYPWSSYAVNAQGEPNAWCNRIRSTRPWEQAPPTGRRRTGSCSGIISIRGWWMKSGVRRTATLPWAMRRSHNSSPKHWRGASRLESLGGPGSCLES